MTEGFLGHAPLEEARSQLRAAGPGVGQREERREAEKTDKVKLDLNVIYN